MFFNKSPFAIKKCCTCGEDDLLDVNEHRRFFLKKNPPKEYHFVGLISDLDSNKFICKKCLIQLGRLINYKRFKGGDNG